MEIRSRSPRLASAGEITELTFTCQCLIRKKHVVCKYSIVLKEEPDFKLCSSLNLFMVTRILKSAFNDHFNDLGLQLHLT